MPVHGSISRALNKWCPCALAYERACIGVREPTIVLLEDSKLPGLAEHVPYYRYQDDTTFGGRSRCKRHSGTAGAMPRLLRRKQCRHDLASTNFNPRSGPPADGTSGQATDGAQGCTRIHTACMQFLPHAFACRRVRCTAVREPPVSHAERHKTLHHQHQTQIRTAGLRYDANQQPFPHAITPRSTDLTHSRALYSGEVAAVPARYPAPIFARM